MKRLNILPILTVLIFGCELKNSGLEIHCLPLLAGEVSETSVVFHARLTASDTLIYGDIHHEDSIFNADIAGKAGTARFIVANNPSFSKSKITGWIMAMPENDFIVKKRVNGLMPDTKYYYKLEYGEDTALTKYSGTNTFTTLPDRHIPKSLSFVMVTGSHLDRFYLGGGFGKPSSQGAEAYNKSDKYLGFPGFETIAKLEPDFFIGNGDNVYYDHPPQRMSKTETELRAKWHRQFFMPRIRNMFSRVPTYWLKDDHDHRFDDSDTLELHPRYGAEPTHELGKRIFIEQVPLTDPIDRFPVTYRTVRAGKLLQLWFVEGRDYRSPNHLPDNAEKTLWGKKQLDWLKNSLMESDATFKILVSPTPMIGPDDARKTDNHVNIGGFNSEGEAFYGWLRENGFLEKNFYIVCGDRHWKYHSIRPDGFEEFSCGALVEQNSRIGRSPGDPDSTDPEARIKQPYSDSAPTGGFLHVKVSNEIQYGGSVTFTLYDQNGQELYVEEKKGNRMGNDLADDR